MELLHKLGIDWKLLIAQIINFFILLFVLYKFAYKPVLHMLDKRAKTIEKGISDAKASEEKLAAIERLRDEKLAQAQKEIGSMLEKARLDAEAVKKELIDAANKQVEDLMRRTRLQIEEEKRKMIADVKREVAQFIIAATGKILEKEFNADDQKRLTEAVTSISL